MRSALWSALLCGVGMSAAAQQRTVTFEEPSPVAITGFAVGRADYDRVSRSNTFTAGKIGLSLFKPVGDAYLFAQLTTALEDGASSTEIDNLLVSWTPHTANKRSEEHTSELQSHSDLVCRLLLEKQNNKTQYHKAHIT